MRSILSFYTTEDPRLFICYFYSTSGIGVYMDRKYKNKFVDNRYFITLVYSIIRMYTPMCNVTAHGRDVLCKYGLYSQFKAREMEKNDKQLNLRFRQGRIVTPPTGTRVLLYEKVKIAFGFIDLFRYVCDFFFLKINCV